MPRRQPTAYRRALERSERAEFADHAAFALTGLGSIAFATGDLDTAEGHYRRALPVANAVSHSWLVAHTATGALEFDDGEAAPACA